MKVKHTIMAAFLLVIVLAACGLVSCGSTEGKITDPVSMTDQLGRHVTIEETPETIISLAPSNTEILFALGLGDRVIGRTDYCNYPVEAEAVASIGGFSDPNIEEIVALGPDLILATSMHEGEVISGLEDLGLTVVGLASTTIDETLEAIAMVGQVTGVTQAAEDLIDSMQQRVDAVTEKTAGLTGDDLKRTYYVVWHDPFMVSGGGTFHDELITLAGGTNLAHDLESYATIGLEDVVVNNPQVLLVGVGMGSGEDLSLQYLEGEERLTETEARQNNAVYAVDMDVAGRAGPRIVDALEEFAACIHPELFD